jgi:hypothetical protein
MNKINRRTLLSTLAKGTVGMASGSFFLEQKSWASSLTSESVQVVERANLPVTQLTYGDKQHWFGYYDKFQIDPSGRYALGMAVDVIFRSPQPNDTLRIGLIDLQNDNQWEEIGTTKAWGWQQGCMLQWIPGSKDVVIWNDIKNGQFISRIVNIKTREKRTLPKAIYALSPYGDYAIGTEFNRIQNMRPGYGYAGIIDPFEQEKSPAEIGIYKMDLKTGENKLLISMKQAADIPHQGEDLSNYWHYFNHLLVSPDGERFVFLHRWRQEMGDFSKRARGGFTTRMITADKNGKDLFILDPSGKTSHFVWRDPKHICAWTQPVNEKSAFYLFKDKTTDYHIVGEESMVENGHNTYVPNTNNEWILNDTYPYQHQEGKQTLYLYHLPTKRKVILGEFFEPEQYKNEWRCDLHPRCDQQGKRVFFDSTHSGDKRQMYMIDIEKIIGQTV